MYCKNCGKNNPEGSKYCQYCGGSISGEAQTASPFQVGTSSNETSANTISQKEPPYPYVISIAKLVIMSVTTAGLYNVYWFYKQWKSMMAERGLKVTPSMRALFAPLWAYSLFKNISKSTQEIDKRKKLEAGGLAVIYVIFVYSYRLPNAWWLVGLLSFLPLIPAQNVLNYFWDKKYDDKLVRSNFGLWNGVVAVAGAIIILLAMYGASLSNNNDSAMNNTTASTTSLVTPVPSPVDIAQSVVHLLCDNNESGSGTILTNNGVVLTNNHVVAGSKSCGVTLPNSTTGAPEAIYTGYPIIVPTLSKQYDIAILQISGSFTDNSGKTWGAYPTEFPAFTPPNSCQQTAPHLGDPVTVYGYPVTSGLFNLTITKGIISSFADNTDILTTAQIDSGNSGGLAVDQNGCFLGIPSAVVSGNYQNLGVIIPTNVLSEFLSQAQTQQTPAPQITRPRNTVKPAPTTQPSVSQPSNNNPGPVVTVNNGTMAGGLAYYADQNVTTNFGTPTISSGSDQGGGNVSLTWNAVSGEVYQYMIYYGNASGNYTNFTESGNSTTHTIGGLTKGLTYYFTVQADLHSCAVNQYGSPECYSPKSREISVTIK